MKKRIIFGISASIMAFITLLIYAIITFDVDPFKDDDDYINNYDFDDGDTP